MNVQKHDVSMKKIMRSIVSLEGEHETVIFTHETPQAARR
jgi:hypothetical protein